MSELTKALNKLWRFDKNVLHNKKSKEELLANVYEELADVSICLQYLIEIYGCKEEVKKSDWKSLNVNFKEYKGMLNKEELI